MKHLARLLSGFALLGSLAGARPAAAQTIAFSTVKLQRPERADDDLALNVINHRDCVDNGVMKYSVTVTNPGSFNLEVWVGGDDCRLSQSRTNGNCWQVFKSQADVVTPADIYVRDIVGQHRSGDALGSGPGSGTADDCTTTDSLESVVTLYFLLLNSAGSAPDAFTALTDDVTYDLLGPEPPTSVTAGIGEEALVVDFTAPENQGKDFNGYYIYCDPAPGTTTTTSSPLPGDGIAGAGGAAGDGNTASAGATATGGTAGTSSAGSGGQLVYGSAECPSMVLAEGGPPPSDAYRCGKIERTGESGQTDDDLVNGQSYTVALAAIDLYGNPGTLSNVTCGVPENVLGFYENYRAAGGKGGGGYCAISGPGREAWPWLGGLAALLVTRKLRRSRTRRSSS